ncbi:MAG: sodium:proton antiporter, partial [Thermoanaerobaculia bacterium]
MQRLSSPLIIGLLIPSIAAVVLLELFTLPPNASGQLNLVTGQLSDSGVEHPVTAVLLNFRGYDTFLEMGVLLLAVLSIWSLDHARHPFQQEQIP